MKGRWLCYFLISVVSIKVYDWMLKYQPHSEHCTKVSDPLSAAVAFDAGGHACQLRVSQALCTHARRSVKTHTQPACAVQTRYERARPVPGSVPLTSLPNRTAATYAFLLARHGTRWPTKKRLKQIAELEELSLPVSRPRRLAQAAHVSAARAVPVAKL